MRTSLRQRHRILVVDDHPMVRDGLQYQINSQDDLEFCGEADGVQSGLELVKSTRPDLAIVDLSLKDGSGLELIQRIHEHNSSVRILVLSMYAESVYGERALRAGAHGYLNKQDSREQLLDAIRCILSGDRFMSRELSNQLIGRAIGASTPPAAVSALSNRELEVFQLIGSGLSTGQIARQLKLSPHTIDSHRERIKSKLGLKNGNALQREAVQWHLENR